MGVLKVWDGTDWRKVGCGGSASFTTVTDDFNRANSTTSIGGTGWTVKTIPVGGAPPATYAFGITANKAYVVSNSGGSGAYSGVYNPILAVQSTAPDFDMTFTIPDLSGSGGFNKSLAVYRVAADFSCYVLGTMNVTYHNGTADTWTMLIGTGTTTVFLAGDVVRILVVGTSHKVYRNGSLLWSFTDSSDVVSVEHGLAGDGPSIVTPLTWDDFTLAPATPPGRLRLWTGTEWVREACDDDFAAPTVISSDTDYDPSATTTTTAPTGIAVGDLLVTFLHSYIPVPTGPAGWTTQFAADDTFKAWACYTKIADSGDVGATFTWTPNTTGYPMHAATLVLRGGTTVSVTGVNSTNGGGAVPFTPSVTALAGGLLVCGFIADRTVFATADPTPLTVPTGMTWRAEIGGSSAGLLVATEVVTAGATGTRTSSTPYNPSYNVGMALVVQPDGGHPLKIEDPANPGTWITVACMVPV